MKVGVLLPSRFEDPGEFLADARAMEAAGADSIWLEEGDGYDPMLALAAIAAVTGRLRLGLITLNTPSPAGGGSARGFETLQHLSRQRVITLIPSPARGGGQGGGLSGSERWRRVGVPADREAWARTLEEARPDFDGVLVPLDPRLLDILRHPEDAIDRSDLMLAQG
ncbi:MAG TPA: LLM class flavin-dependent oxidoreductase [Candidatus Dormibacteraeota bacterium]|nr:LLM class flavin-dependent oxidoreductase [Candidatus Dormibacteraeota bacterium]